MMRNKISQRVLFGVLVVALAYCTGCSKISTETYDQIQMGMQYEDIIALLGKADQCDGAMGIKNCTWGDEDRYIAVSFAGGKVILFSAHGL